MDALLLAPLLLPVMGTTMLLLSERIERWLDDDGTVPSVEPEGAQPEPPDRSFDALTPSDEASAARNGPATRVVEERGAATRA